MRGKNASRGRRQGGQPVWLTVGATAVAAVLVAEGAAWLLRPKDAIEPVSVDESAYFPSEQVERAREYRSGQRLLFVGGLAAQGAILVLLATGRPAPARRALERAGERPVLGGAAAAGGLVVLLTAAALPFDVAAHERAVDVGLSTQDLGDWLADAGKSGAITAVIAAGVGTGALALMRRFGERWWIPGSAAAVALGVLSSWLAPVVLAPLFNRFDPLEPGQAREDVLELGNRAGVDIGEVYEVDASRRSTTLNAYVNGLGPTKRVVLYDTLIEGLDRGERRSVIAHELAHVKGRDIPRGILFVAISTPLTLFAAAALARALGRRSGAEPGEPAFLPALAISLALASFAVGTAGNQLSRGVEAKADTEALELTDDPQALIALQQRLAATNLSDPSPPGIVTFLLGTHPPATERIGAALAYEKAAAPAPPADAP
jgi:STE24 endopeptidase